MVDFEVPLPPAKEGFDLPMQLVDQGDLFGGQVKTAGGNPGASDSCGINGTPSDRR